MAMPDMLFLSHRIPYPPDKGDKIRAWHMLRHLAQTYRVHLGCLADDPADLAHLPLLRSICASVACPKLDKRRQKLHALAGLRPGRPLTLDYFYNAGLQQWVTRTLAQNPVRRLFVFSSAMVAYVMRKGLARIPGVLDMVDIDSEKWKTYAQQAGLPMRLVWAREGRTLLAYERRAAAWFDHTVFVSEDECRRFVTLAPEIAARAGWVENGVDLEYFSASQTGTSPYPSGSRAIVFTGTMDYRPNIDAVSFFARSVMPKLRASHKDIAFHIVGANPAPAVQALADLPEVHVAGRVADMRPFIGHAALAVAPLRIARGVQNKVLEAMAMARPVLVSPEALEGLRAQPGRDLLVADDASSMAARAAEVLDGAHPALGPAARAMVEREYPWSTTLRRLDTLVAPL
jgi:sugar transferase (PEP-CTERM/EpsH1 system associated)